MPADAGCSLRAQAADCFAAQAARELVQWQRVYMEHQRPGGLPPVCCARLEQRSAQCLDTLRRAPDQVWWDRVRSRWSSPSRSRSCQVGPCARCQCELTLGCPDTDSRWHRCWSGVGAVSEHVLLCTSPLEPSLARAHTTGRDGVAASIRAACEHALRARRASARRAQCGRPSL